MPPLLRCNSHYPRGPMLHNLWRGATRLMSTTATSTLYPFSKTAVISSPSQIQNVEALQMGKGLIQHLRETLPSPEKQAMIRKLFSRHSRECLLPGSIVTVTLEHAPSAFTGVLLSIRRRGSDTSFVLRNVIQRTGVEMQFFVASPHLKEIKVIKRPPKERMRKAKLYYLRDYPEKMSMIAGSR